ncbi:hypothetical protein DSO57_1037407 [Entomophthora muscae]|uniref:Uncharacterized protein n=2 Tax=Entomophthora muscae TaxID=34485 RepID=A0ACC2SFC9_9FUNG|nr:hypothetical protein DSO57_1023771 [Entomophthora muscae]KAJ9079246.1 hypothetical protein DSO57_1037407 [Entomophthora muscae]
MYMEMILSAAILYVIGSYVALGYEAFTSYFAMSRIQREPLDYNQGFITTTILPSNLNLRKFRWSGTYKKNQVFEKSLDFLGPRLFKSVCFPATLISSNTELCFWIEKSSLLISDPYYPEEELQCIRSNRCYFQLHLKLANKDMFLPSSGIASTTIPQHIHTKPQLNATSSSPKLPYDGELIKHPWIRTFHWKYEGKYTLSSRPYKEFNFTYFFPVLLPSGTPNAIYGLCHLKDIKDLSCSKNIFN